MSNPTTVNFRVAAGSIVRSSEKLTLCFLDKYWPHPLVTPPASAGLPEQQGEQ
jgi:hypothetical protein